MSQKRNPGFLLKAQTGISGFQRDAKGENQVLTGYRGGRKENGQARLSGYLTPPQKKQGRLLTGNPEITWEVAGKNRPCLLGLPSVDYSSLLIFSITSSVV